MNIFMYYILPIILIIVILAIACVMVYFKTLYEIEKAIAGEIVDAEETDETTEEEEARQKQAVVDKLYELVPQVLKPFITENLISKLVQVLFDKCKAFAVKQAEKKANKSGGENVIAESESSGAVVETGSSPDTDMQDAVSAEESERQPEIQ